MFNEKNDVYVETLRKDADKTLELFVNKTTKSFVVKKIIKQPCNAEIYRQIEKHPHINIAKVIDVEETRDDVIVIEEFIQGRTLEDILEEHTFTEQNILQIMLQVCDAIEHLHKLNPPIIHRDIKPENIMLDHERVVIIDFDISRTFDASKRKDTQVLGSKGFAAPEQFGFGQSDGRSDIYAIGVLINVLGTRCFPNEKMMEGKLKKIVHKCTELDPKQRYQTCSELKEALKKEQKFKLFNSVIKSNKSVSFDFPGYQTGQLKNSIFATFWYAICIFVALMGKFEGNISILESLLMRCAIVIWSITGAAIVSDYRGIYSRNRPKRMVKNGGNLMLKFVLAYLSLLPILLVVVIILEIFQ